MTIILHHIFNTLQAGHKISEADYTAYLKSQANDTSPENLETIEILLANLDDMPKDNAIRQALLHIPGNDQSRNWACTLIDGYISALPLLSDRITQATQLTTLVTHRFSKQALEWQRNMLMRLASQIPPDATAGDHTLLLDIHTFLAPNYNIPELDARLVQQTRKRIAAGDLNAAAQFILSDSTAHLREGIFSDVLKALPDQTPATRLAFTDQIPPHAVPPAFSLDLLEQAAMLAREHAGYAETMALYGHTRRLQKFLERNQLSQDHTSPHLATRLEGIQNEVVKTIALKLAAEPPAEQLPGIMAKLGEMAHELADDHLAMVLQQTLLSGLAHIPAQGQESAIQAILHKAATLPPDITNAVIEYAWQTPQHITLETTLGQTVFGTLATLKFQPDIQQRGLSLLRKRLSRAQNPAEILGLHLMCYRLAEASFDTSGMEKHKADMLVFFKTLPPYEQATLHQQQQETILHMPPKFQSDLQDIIQAGQTPMSPAEFIRKMAARPKPA